MSDGIRLLQVRYCTAPNSTLSVLHEQTDTGLEFLCYLLEPGKREPKIEGETRVPSGIYRLRLRDSGGFHGRYEKKFPRMHRGMIELVDVRGWEFVLLHIGNYPKDTQACLLLGSEPGHSEDGLAVYSSTLTYKKLYPRIADGIISGKSFLTIIDAA